MAGQAIRNMGQRTIHRDEAMKILDIKEEFKIQQEMPKEAEEDMEGWVADHKHIMERYDRLMERNTQEGGSFYL